MKRPPFSASLPRRHVYSLLPSVTVGLVCAAVLLAGGRSATAADDDWTSWQPLPDQYQGAVDFRYHSETRPGGVHDIVCQFRNRYVQKVTLTLQIEGDAADSGPHTLRETATLSPGNAKHGHEEKEQRLDLSRIRQISVLDIGFEGAPPPATPSGVQGESEGTRNIHDRVDRLRQELNQAGDDLHNAELHSANLRADLSSPNGATLVAEDGVRYRIDEKDQYQADSDARRIRDRVRSIADRLEAAQKELKAAQAQDTQAFGLLERAHQAGTAGDWTAAAAGYRQALSDPALNGFGDKDRAAVYADLGMALRHTGKPADAEAAYSKAVDLAPQNPTFRASYGEMLLAQDKAQEAEAPLREAITLNPSDAGYHHNLGMALCLQGKYAEAEAEYREALRLGNPNDTAANAETENGLGAALSREGRIADATAAFREAVRLQPQRAAYHRSLGVALTQQQSWPEAEAALKEALRRGLNDAYAQDCLGVALYSQEKYADALKAFQEAVRLEPGNADYASHRSAAQERLKPQNSSVSGGAPAPSP